MSNVMWVLRLHGKGRGRNRQIPRRIRETMELCTYYNGSNRLSIQNFEPRRQPSLNLCTKPKATSFTDKFLTVISVILRRSREKEAQNGISIE